MNEREVYRDEVDFAEHNYKERYSDMPCVGTRVRRGCHWNYENQDNLGVGTVIGHSERSQSNSLIVLKILNKTLKSLFNNTLTPKENYV